MTVSWDKLCSALLELSWEMYSSNKTCADMLRSKFLKHNAPVLYHVRSSIWPAIRQHLATVKASSCWLLGNGKNINLWSDKWLPQSLADMLNLPDNILPLLKAKVQDIIVDNSWCFPDEFVASFPNVVQIIHNVQIPVVPTKDALVWQSSTNGSLSFKEAYEHVRSVYHHSQARSWGKLIWNACVPPSRSFMLWRLLNNKAPTDENLRKMGCIGVSICSLCGNSDESSDHLFLRSRFAKVVWSWFVDIVKVKIDFTSFNSSVYLWFEMEFSSD